MPAAGNGFAGRDEPPMNIDEHLQVDPVLAVLAREQVGAVAPVERRNQGPVDQKDPPAERGGELVVGGAQYLRQEGDHHLVVVPGRGGTDGEILMQVVVGGVAAQPTQRQAQRLEQGQHPRPSDTTIPFVKFLFRQFEDDSAGSLAHAGEAVHWGAPFPWSDSCRTTIHGKGPTMPEARWAFRGDYYLSLNGDERWTLRP